jgi:hypothetical protein
MSRTFKIAVLVAAVCVVTSAAAQTGGSTSTTTKTTQKSGVIEAVYGNHVVLREADGTTHEYTVPEGFHFQMNGQPVTVADLKPGMSVNATITDETTTKDVVVTRNVSGTVMQVAPGGIVVKGEDGKLTSYGATDLQGRDVTITRSGQSVSVLKGDRPIMLSQLKKGDRLNATIVTDLPPQTVSKRSVTASVTPAPEPAAGGAGTAGTTAAALPKTASPLPFVGLLAALALLSALVLRGFGRVRRA